VTPVRIVHDDGSATISAADRGLLYGDGLFETLACRNGQPRFLSAHLDRLSAGCARLGMPEPPRQQLESAIRLAAGRGVAGGRPAARALVKLILTRGASSERGYAPPAVVSPCCIIQAFPWPADTAQHGERGVAVQYSRVPLTENPLLAGIKHLNRLDSVLARAALAGSDCAEALLCAADGAVVCGSMSNLFIVRAGRHRRDRPQGRRRRGRRAGLGRRGVRAAPRRPRGGRRGLPDERTHRRVARGAPREPQLAHWRADAAAAALLRRHPRLRRRMTRPAD
jgi:aminodeoxychorismate lyase